MNHGPRRIFAPVNSSAGTRSAITIRIRFTRMNASIAVGGMSDTCRRQRMMIAMNDEQETDERIIASFRSFTESESASIRADLLMFEAAVREHERWARKSQVFDHNRKCLHQCSKNVQDRRKRVLDRINALLWEYQACNEYRRDETT